MNVILPPSLSPYPEISPPDAPHKSTSRFPDKIAAVHGSRTATFEELNTRCNRIALDLVALGVQPGQRVALMGQNSIEYIAAFFGILKAGGVIVPFSPAYSARGIDAQLRACEPSAAIVDADLIELFVMAGGHSIAREKRICIEKSSRSAGPFLADLYASSTGAASLPRLGPDHLAVIAYSSGTPGVPKR